MNINELIARMKAAAQDEIMCREACDTSDLWQDAASPESVLALTEALGAAEKRIAEAYAGWGNCQRTMGIYCHAYEEAKAHIAELVHNHRFHAAKFISERGQMRGRIAELEARTLIVTLPESYYPDGDIDCPLAMSKDDVIEAIDAACAAAGIKLQIEGEE